MKKHYVMLEYTTEDEEDVKFIPWGGLLQGAINCTNWKHIEPESLKNHCNIQAMHLVVNEHSFETDEEAYVALKEASIKNPYSNTLKEIVVCGPFEDMDVSTIMYEISIISSAMIDSTLAYMGIEITDFQGVNNA